MEYGEVLETLLENLYYSMGDMLTVFNLEKLARAYFIAKQLVEFGTVDKDEIEENVKQALKNNRE